jgi:acyl-CoA synthetase (AMP-forming)/AMP-acid ligase II
MVTQFKTLVEMLRLRARENPGQAAFTFGEQTITFSALWQAVNRFAACLLHHRLARDDRVVLALPNGPEFFSAFYGVQRAGGTAVPIYPDSGPERAFAIAGLCDARGVVVPSTVPESGRREYEQEAAARGLFVLTVSETESHSVDLSFPEVRPDDVAFIQYTSGSTGNPKGVLLSHANLIANVDQMVRGMGITEREVFVSWLPVHHDMGLILMTMAPFFVGAKLVLLPARLVSFRNWLAAIEEHKATYTAAPDFAYRFCLRNIRNPSEFDLSSLRIALNAAEPVRTRTVVDFERAFGLKNVMMPAYGLAEATVGVSMWGPGRKIKVDTRGFVSVGSGFPDVEMKSLRDGESVGPGVVGEILVKSPGNTRGYFGNPQESTELSWGDDYIRTGDLGYRDADGDLFVVGRSKNIIIHAGQNISPQEVEETVDVLPFVRFAAALGIDRGRFEGEQVYVFVEVKANQTTPELAFHDMTVQIVEKIHTRLGFRPGRTYFLARGSIPRTDTGKTQHSRLKSQFVDGHLRAEGRILFPDY